MLRVCHWKHAAVTWNNLKIVRLLTAVKTTPCLKSERQNLTHQNEGCANTTSRLQQPIRGRVVKEHNSKTAIRSTSTE